MTARQVWEALLTELSKVKAPSMLLPDFNYYINKAVNQYINKRYNIYDVNQQTTDDLRVLKASALLDVEKVSDSKAALNLAKFNTGKAKLFNATYESNLPSDYYHILNCICIYQLNKDYKCWDKDNYVQFAAKRLTADAWSTVVNDYYNRPLPWRPYYYLHNININSTVPTNPLTTENTDGTDLSKKYAVTVNDTSHDVEGDSNFSRILALGTPDGREVSTVERDTATRYGNPAQVRLEIRYGNDDTVFSLKNVFVDYLKTPQFIRLTQEQVDLTQDTSQIMEFPDYVCQEIINELVMLVMENNADPRLQTSVQVNQSVANPAQRQAAQ